MESTSTQEVEWIVPKQAAKILGVTNFTLQNWRAKGRGPAFHKRGPNQTSRVLYTRHELNEFLAKSMVRHTPAEPLKLGGEDAGL